VIFDGVLILFKNYLLKDIDGPEMAVTKLFSLE